MKIRIAIPVLLLAIACILVFRSTSAQATFRSEHFTTSDSVKLHYLEAGDGPMLVFVPGWTMPAEIWENQINYFASTHRVIALDPRGQGRSQKPTYGYHPERRALDIGELLEHLGAEPAVIVAWSLAVQEVLVYAHKFGTKAIRAVVLVDYQIHWEDPERLKSRFISLQTERTEWTRKFIEVIHHRPQSYTYFDTLTEAALSTPTNAAAIMIANLILMGPTDLRPALKSLDKPVLFVASSLDWAIAEAEKVREKWPHVKVEVINETSHALFVDKPEEFNRVLEAFLSSIR